MRTRPIAALHLRKSVRRDHAERAQGLVEFAMITPFILIFLFIIVDFGIGLNRRVVVTNDAREGARYAATGKSAGDVMTLVQKQSEGLIKNGSASTCGADGATKCVNVQYFRGSGIDDSVAVTINYAYKPITPMPAFITFPKSFKMYACSVMRLEQLPSPPPTTWLDPQANPPCSST